MASERQAILDRPLPILSWAMYDFANTIYSAIVVTAFFPLFMSKLSGCDLYTGVAQTVSMVLAGLAMPVAGAIADRTGRAKTYLWWVTLACCLATAAIGLVANDRLYDAAAGMPAPTLVVLGALLCFGLANLCYQGSLVFYDCLLPVVASPARQGRVSGLGVGVGYFGVVVALPIAYWAVRAAGAMRVSFFVAGAAFFAAALPVFFLVHVLAPQATVRVTRRVVSEQLRGIGRTLRHLWGLPPVLFFFIGNFLCTDVVNTLIMWTRPYLMGGAGYTAESSIGILMAMSVSALALGLCMGWLTDWLGAKRALLAAAGSLGLCILVASVTHRAWVLVPTILLFGSGGLAGVWVAGRKFLLDIAPPEKVGEFFGFYGVTQKLSVFGCTLFALMADWTGSYRVALSSLLVPLAVGMAFLAVSRPQRLASTEERTNGNEPGDAVRGNGPASS
ncbi:MAG: MFS transporter [Planctomycetes bacterium]|nr:MFS transporter [Planctomycetota bacterium]